MKKEGHVEEYHTKSRDHRDDWVVLLAITCDL